MGLLLYIYIVAAVLLLAGAFFAGFWAGFRTAQRQEPWSRM